MSAPVVSLLRFVHVLAALAWVGGVFFWAMIIVPGVLRRGPAQVRRPFLETVLPKVIRFFLASGIVAVLFGILLLVAMWNQDYDATFAVPGYAVALAIGSLLGLVMLAQGAFFLNPAIGRLAGRYQSSAASPPSPALQAELASLEKGLAMQSMVAVILGTLALAGMVVAVNAAR